MSRPLIPNIQQRYPGFYTWKSKEYSRVWVPVDRIIGTIAPNDYRFYEDWSPTPEGRDPRFMRVEDSMRRVGWYPSTQYKKFPPALPHLMKIGNEYFVGNDGNRRVSMAHVLHIKKIQADVTELFPGTRNDIHVAGFG